MLFGIPAETKIGEHRVALTPESARELTSRNQTVLIQSGAGDGSGYSDDSYRKSGCQIAKTADEVWGTADLIVKVKEPQPYEYDLIREDSALFTFLHLAADVPLANTLLNKSVLGIAYETVTHPSTRFPILAPMSAIAGQLAVHAAGHHLQRAHGGLGKLISRIQGAPAADVVVIGAGTVGQNSAQLALANGATVTLIDVAQDRLDQFASDHSELAGTLKTVISTPETVEESAKNADVVIGAVYSPGRRPPVLLKEDQVQKMQQGAVLVDVAVDQGGCFETTHATTYEDPTYNVHGVVHYAVANMPGAVPKTATAALSNATLPYLIRIAEQGIVEALKNDEGFASGVNTYKGTPTDPGLAAIMGTKPTPFAEAIA
ncbi:alanine dehydrogenase [Candidatus Lucifugimonas marina]|uniref:Alanine dehydrogenase n=1 Tax=Candidatus Lucifugimonas marina TaxID=3038979 RepID=A0AAJ6CTS8_9CHLR|nr:alanine dehydrogenase [SAR202 cluster bacterium JH702]MDG0869325.1 alanine dehydrogenase [SAR202 cluster bacterium JH639]WFG36724.1 alanine dehydrogenase [SAR202 cluster bacterium JH545]WFG40658.1 alanine dehydrogenase [SAR202 cluster bacterium JH1073]